MSIVTDKDRQRAVRSPHRPAGMYGLTKKYQKALKKLQDKFPDIMDALVATAIGSKEYKCPHCKAKLNVPVPKDSQVLIHLDNRVQGKPVQRDEIELSAHGDMSSDQLARWLDRVQEANRSYLERDVTIIEAEVREIPNPLQIASPSPARSANDQPHDAARSGNQSTSNNVNLNNNLSNINNSYLNNNAGVQGAREDHARRPGRFQDADIIADPARAARLDQELKSSNPLKPKDSDTDVSDYG